MLKLRAVPQLLSDDLEWRWTRLTNLTGALLTLAAAIAQIAGKVKGAGLAYAAAALLVFAFGFWRRGQHLENAVRRLQARLQEAERLATVGLSTAGFAHELRNSVMVAHGLAEMARRAAEQGGGEEQLARARALEEQTAQMTAELQAFLGLSRGEGAETMPLALVVARTLRLLGPLARLKELSVENVVDELPERPVYDPDFRRALLNLVLNAVGHARTEVRVSATQRDGRIELAVEDDGPGVPSERRVTLFTPFASSEASGTGLGLFQARRAVEREGGTLVYEDRPGGGARFVIRLPPLAALV